MKASSRRALVRLAAPLALAGCADREFEQHGSRENAEAVGQVARAVLSGKQLKETLKRLEGSAPPACNLAELCPTDAEGEPIENCTVTPSSSFDNVLHVTGDLTFPADAPCTFMGHVEIDASDVELDCKGSVIDARAAEWFGIQHSERQLGNENEAPHAGCAAAKRRAEKITIRNCTVKYAERDGITFERSLGQVRLDASTCTSEHAAFFGPSVAGMHYPPYPLPEYLRSELDGPTRSLLDGPLSDETVLKILRDLGPKQIVLENVALLFNQRTQLYVRQYTTDFTVTSSLFVQSPHGLPLAPPTFCGDDPTWCAQHEPEIFDCAETLDWDCAALPASSQERPLCDAIVNACKEDTRWTVYVDRDSQRTSIVDVDLRQSISAGPYPEADVPAEVDVPGPRHVALDSTSDNRILASRFSGKANGIFAFKNCGESDSYRSQNSERNKIEGNVFELAPEATAVWLGQRQGGRYNGNPDSPLNCFRQGESYPWLTLPSESERFFVFSPSMYESLSASDYCRQEKPPLVSCREDDGDCPFPTPMFFDASFDNDIRGNWFIRQPSAMPSVILWEGTHQVANRSIGNFTNFDQGPGTAATMAAVCRRNDFLALLDHQSPDGASGVSRLEHPAGLSNTSVAQLHMAFSAIP